MQKTRSHIHQPIFQRIKQRRAERVKTKAHTDRIARVIEYLLEKRRKDEAEHSETLLCTCMDILMEKGAADRRVNLFLSAVARVLKIELSARMRMVKGSRARCRHEERKRERSF